MEKDVQLFLKFEDYKNKNELKAVQALIPLTPYWFWKEGDFVTKSDGTSSKSKYKYSNCVYMQNANYNSLEDDIYNMLNIFIPFEQELITLKEKYDFEITFTLHFDFKKNYYPL